MTYTVPPSTPADGNIKTLWVPAIADIRAPKLAELSAAGVVDISLYITKGGFEFAPEQQFVEDAREPLKFTGQALGNVSVSNTAVTVIDNTGGPYESTDNDAVEALEGDGYIVRRYGPAWDAALAATTQKVTVLDCAAGEKTRLPNEANSTFRSKVPLAVRDYAQDVAIATS